MTIDDRRTMEGFVLETDRLILRELRETDAPFILGLLNEPSFLAFIGDKGVRDLDGARTYIRTGPLASYAAHGFGLYLTVRREDDEPIGICGILKRDTLDHPDIGFAFRPAFWRQGYCSEAARATLAFGRRDLGLRRIVAVTSVDNVGSRKVLEKIGMRLDGSIRLGDDEEPVHLFA